ncbi:hypothetical protein RKD56_004225 [Priestia megaterium]
MKINLQHNELERVQKELNTNKTASFKFDEKSFYVRVDEINFKPKSSIMDIVLTIESACEKIDKGLLEGLGSHYVFTTIARNKVSEIQKTGKMVSVFFSTNDRLEAIFPYELIAADQCDPRVVINKEL